MAKVKPPLRVQIIYMGANRTPGGCEIYRGNMPMYFLNDNSKSVNGGWAYFEAIWEDYRKYGIKAWVDLVTGSDIFVFPRMYIPDGIDGVRNAIVDFFMLLRGFDKRIVYEVDDDYTNEFRPVVEGDSIQVAKWCDAITVTTPYLARRMQRLSGRPTFIAPNYLDPNLWFKPNGPQKKDPNHLFIGLTGSQTHYNDWIILKDVMPIILERYPHVRFLLAGFHPDYFENLPNTEYWPGLPYGDYAQIVKVCDIIVAAVDPNDGFNLGKSPIKAVEGMGAARQLANGSLGGAAVIATDNPIYQLAINHSRNGVLTEHTHEGWLQNLSELIERAEYRQQLQEQAFKDARRHWDLGKHWKVWESAYQKISRLPMNPVRLSSFKES